MTWLVSERDCAPDDYSGRDNIIRKLSRDFDAAALFDVSCHIAGLMPLPRSLLLAAVSKGSSQSQLELLVHNTGVFTFSLCNLLIVQCDLRNFEAHVFAVSELLRSKWVQWGEKLFIISTFIFRVLTMVN